MRQKQLILDEIKRTAEANGGAPLGSARFSQETGIKNSDWLGKIWARWGDALREAGFQSNELQTAYSVDRLVEKFIELARELGRLPVNAEVDMKARSNDSFPWYASYRRKFGSKPQLIKTILEYCQSRLGHEDVVALCKPLASLPLEEAPSSSLTEAASATKEGYVYLCLLKLGRERRYKIGKAVLVQRRTDQISIQLPAELELVHTITTDDAYGIEGYWHRRFAAKNTNGEWFLLSRQDVDAFKRRKFM